MCAHKLCALAEPPGPPRPALCGRLLVGCCGNTAVNKRRLFEIVEIGIGNGGGVFRLVGVAHCVLGDYMDPDTSVRWIDMLHGRVF